MVTSCCRVTEPATFFAQCNLGAVCLSPRWRLANKVTDITVQCDGSDRLFTRTWLIIARVSKCPKSKVALALRASWIRRKAFTATNLLARVGSELFLAHSALASKPRSAPKSHIHACGPTVVYRKTCTPLRRNGLRANAYPTNGKASEGLATDSITAMSCGAMGVDSIIALFFGLIS